jgi:hypothetical protein
MKKKRRSEMEMRNEMEMEGEIEMEMEREMEMEMEGEMEREMERDVERDVEKQMERDVVFFIIFLIIVMLFRTVEWKCPVYLLENNFTHSSLQICVIAKVVEFHLLHFMLYCTKITIFAFWKILWQKSKLLRVRIQLFVFREKFWQKISDI